MKVLICGFLSFFAMSSAQAVTKAEVIQNISQNVIAQTYLDFDRDAKSLLDAVKLLRAEPTQENLEKAQRAWKAARWSYEVSEGFLFGPIDSLGIDPMIDSWPLALTEMKAILASNMPLSADTIRPLNTEVQGFHAIEYILFGEGIVSNTRSVEGITERQYDYLEAVSVILTEQTDLLVYAWTVSHDPEEESSPAYLNVLLNPSASNQFYKSESDVVHEFVNGIVTIIGEASRAKLPDATGETPQDANARLEESPFSWNSIVDYTSNVESIYNVYTGSYNGEKKGLGIKDLIAQKDAAVADLGETLILESRQAIADISGTQGLSFGQAIKDQEGRKRIFAAIAKLKILETFFTEQVTPLLD